MHFFLLKIKRKFYFILPFFLIFLFFLLFLSSLGLENKRDYLNNLNLEKREKVKYLRVVDGDTILVLWRGKKERVRIIGIDSPESVKVGTKKECFGDESSLFLKKFLEKNGKYIFLEFDKTQGFRDSFGRLLAHVFDLHGKNIGVMLLQLGFARRYYKNDYHPSRYYNLFLKAEEKAKKQKKGLWAVCTEK